MTPEFVRYNRLTDKGVETRVLGQGKSLIPWADIAAYKIKSAVYGFRAAPKSFYGFTGYFMTRSGGVVKAPCADSMLSSLEELEGPEGPLFALKKRLVAETMKKISMGEEAVFSPKGAEIILKRDSIETVRRGRKNALPLKSVGSALPNHDGISIFTIENEVFFETQKPFYNRSILPEVLSLLKNTPPEQGAGGVNWVEN